MSRMQVALIDNQYMTMGAHIDTTTHRKIKNGDYVDLAKLLPKDRIEVVDDHRMEIVNKGGFMYWLPVADREVAAINSYAKWEQAFRLYMNIFAKANPDRIIKLLQYNTVIEKAAMAFQWECMYRFDKEFRLHMSVHPEHNWGIILQQVWTLCMKNSSNQHTPATKGNQFHSNGNSDGSGQKKRICFKFNQGICTFGFNCKFEHKCGLCGKFGHGTHNCCRALFPSDGKHTSGGKQQNQHNQNNHNNSSSSRRK